MLLKLILIYLLSIISSVLYAAEVSHQSLAIIVNVNDKNSLELARYYQQARSIPEQNIIYISLDATKNSISAADFLPVYRQVKKASSHNIQAYALAWSKPFRVGCMSITSAFALGYNKKYCAIGCKTTSSIPYYNSKSRQPFNDYKIRPSIMLAGSNLSTSKKTIDQGIKADYKHSKGTAYLLSTFDKERNVRAVFYPKILKNLSSLLNIKILKQDKIKNKKDVMFYFTGLKHVKEINSNHFIAGAVADHLTSTGGVLFGGKQMSILRWLDAGATASYGTVVEPCNFLSKFPNPGILMSHYLNGETLLEAYWKSVLMPGQGVFVGEPLASPYKGCRIKISPRGIASFIQMPINNYVMRSSRRC